MSDWHDYIKPKFFNNYIKESKEKNIRLIQSGRRFGKSKLNAIFATASALPEEYREDFIYSMYEEEAQDNLNNGYLGIANLITGIQ
jgi:hypothetical protein